MFFKRHCLFVFLLISPLQPLNALICHERIEYFNDAFSNKCMRCEPLNKRNPGQSNCIFPNTDHCCEADTCNETHPHFSKWIDGICEVPSS